MDKKLDLIIQKLADERSKKVIFLSHCILNENTRYLGGAGCKGINTDFLKDLRTTDCGVVQLPCPEQLVWGGIFKKLLWVPMGSRKKPFYCLLRLIYPLFLLYTKCRFYRLASKTVSLIRDYTSNGFEVVGILGVDGSPSCGVNKTLSMGKAFEYFADLSVDSLERDDFNRRLYERCTESGQGIFMNALIKKLAKVKKDIPFSSIDLKKELFAGFARL